MASHSLRGRLLWFVLIAIFVVAVVQGISAYEPLAGTFVTASMAYLKEATVALVRKAENSMVRERCRSPDRQPDQRWLAGYLHRRESTVLHLQAHQ